MKIKAIKCLNCDDIIYSRGLHDYRCCSCGSVCVDGGFDYFKVSANNLSKVKYIEIEIDATKEELYQDWDLGINKYGLIRKEERNNEKN